MNEPMNEEALDRLIKGCEIWTKSLDERISNLGKNRDNEVLKTVREVKDDIKKITDFLEVIVDKLSDMDNDIEKKYQNLKYQISAK